MRNVLFTASLAICLVAAMAYAGPAVSERIKTVPTSAVAASPSGLAPIHNPEVPLTPVSRNPMTPEQLNAYEQAKAARNPMTTIKIGDGMGYSTIDAAAAGWQGAEAKVGAANATQNSSQNGKGPLWGTNTTVMTGSVAWANGGCRPISFDSDSAGNFYALVSIDTTAGFQLMLYKSIDDGQTWQVTWQIPTDGICSYSKLIVVPMDSLYFYTFYVNASGRAAVWRINNSSATFNHYILRADSAAAIAAAWDQDRVYPYFHVAIEKAGPVNVQGLQYVRGTGLGKTWTTPTNVYFNATQPSIATGNVGRVANNIFLSFIWTVDSSAYVVYDSSSTWMHQKIGGELARKEEHSQIAASHSTTGLDSVRVWLAYTHWLSGTNRDLYYSYNLFNGKGGWNKDHHVPGAAKTGRQEWGCSMNVPNWTSAGSVNADVELSYYSDSTGSYQVKQNWMTNNGYADPTSWSAQENVNDYAHSSYALSYATRIRHGITNSVVGYPGWGSQNVYFNGYWYTGVADTPTAVSGPSTAKLEQNAPNPAGGYTAISYQLPVSGRVSLKVFNIAGQLVATLVNGEQPTGRHTVGWNGRDGLGKKVSSGVYLYRLESGGQSVTKRLTIVK